MCHHPGYEHEWTSETIPEETSEETELGDDLPEFLADTEVDEDVEIVTDGGEES